MEVGDYVLVLLRPPALAGTVSGSLIVLAARYSFIALTGYWIDGS